MNGGIVPVAARTLDRVFESLIGHCCLSLVSVCCVVMSCVGTGLETG
jgi:hypothetical protein